MRGEGGIGRIGLSDLGGGGMQRKGSTEGVGLKGMAKGGEMRTRHAVVGLRGGNGMTGMGVAVCQRRAMSGITGTVGEAGQSDRIGGEMQVGASAEREGGRRELEKGAGSVNKRRKVMTWCETSPDLLM